MLKRGGEKSKQKAAKYLLFLTSFSVFMIYNCDNYLISLEILDKENFNESEITQAFKSLTDRKQNTTLFRYFRVHLTAE